MRLALWMFGSQIESDWGSKRFLEFYFFCTVAAALTSVAVSYMHLPGLSPTTTTIGASGGIYGLLVAFGVLYGESEIMLFPLPFQIKAKYFVWGIVFLTLGGSDSGDRRCGQLCASWGIAFRLSVSEIPATQRSDVCRFANAISACGTNITAGSEDAPRRSLKST